jgi:hypothetical protein
VHSDTIRIPFPAHKKCPRIPWSIRKISGRIKTPRRKPGVWGTRQVHRERSIEEKSKPAPLKSKGAAPLSRKPTARIPRLVSAPPVRHPLKKTNCADSAPHLCATPSGKRSGENSDGFDSRRRRESKPAPLKPKGAAPLSRKPIARIPRLISAPPVPRLCATRPTRPRPALKNRGRGTLRITGSPGHPSWA